MIRRHGDNARRVSKGAIRALSVALFTVAAAILGTVVFVPAAHAVIGDILTQDLTDGVVAPNWDSGVGQVFTPAQDGLLDTATFRLSTSGSGCVWSSLRVYAWNGSPDDNPASGKGTLLAEANQQYVCSGTGYPAAVDFTYSFNGTNEVPLRAGTLYFLEFDFSGRGVLPPFQVPSMAWGTYSDGSVTTGNAWAGGGSTWGGVAGDLYLVIRGIADGKIAITAPQNGTIFPDQNLPWEVGYAEPGDGVFDTLQLTIRDFLTGAVVRTDPIALSGTEQELGSHTKNDTLTIPRSGFFALSAELRDCRQFPCIPGAATGSTPFSLLTEPTQSDHLLFQSHYDSSSVRGDLAPVGQVFKPENSGRLETATLKMQTLDQFLAFCQNASLRLYAWTGGGNDIPATGRGALLATSDPRRICYSTFFGGPQDAVWTFPGGQVPILSRGTSYYLEFSYDDPPAPERPPTSVFTSLNGSLINGTAFLDQDLLEGDLFLVLDGAMDAPAREPVIIVPGIVGSALYRGTDLIWPDTHDMFGFDDYFLTEALSMSEDGNSQNTIHTLNIIDEIRLIFPELGIDAPLFNIFKGLLNQLEAHGYVMNSSYFTFPYDWRLNLNNTKDALSQKVEEIKAQTGFDKVNIVAHSMGGLLVKNYLSQYGKGSVDKIIFVGTPHLGAPKVAKVLLDGDQFGIPWLEEDRIQEIAENSPAVYELLPNQTYFTNFNGYIKPYVGEFKNYSETKDFLIGEGLNATVFSQAESFFSNNLENTDFSGVDTYNIAGCENGTQAAYQLAFVPIFSRFGKAGYASGDGTVPLGSADYINIPVGKKFYAHHINHSGLPSIPDVRDAIASILSGEEPTLTDNFTNSSASCDFKGKELVWRSPVEVHVYDAQNRHTGPIENNGIEYGIPGVDYEIIGHEKFIFLPTGDGEQYRVEAQGTDTGTFDFLISENDNGTVVDTMVFNDVPVTISTTIESNVSADSSDNFIAIDQHNSAGMQNVPASAELSGDQGGDLVTPTSTASSDGTLGTSGWYRTNVTVTLSATDDNSGILETRYSLNNGATFSTYTTPFVVSQEGINQVLYYSVDRAGNNEEKKTLEIKMDKTAPEFATQFSTSTKKFVFSATDNLDTSSTIACVEGSCTAKDKAGNITILRFERDRDDDEYELGFEKISHNGIQMTFPDNELEVKYDEDNGKIDDFDQEFELKDKDILIIEYDKDRKRSTIYTRQPDGTYKKETVPGTRILQIVTNGGTIKSLVK